MTGGQRSMRRPRSSRRCEVWSRGSSGAVPASRSSPSRATTGPDRASRSRPGPAGEDAAGDEDWGGYRFASSRLARRPMERLDPARPPEAARLRRRDVSGRFDRRLVHDPLHNVVPVTAAIRRSAFPLRAIAVRDACAWLRSSSFASRRRGSSAVVRDRAFSEPLKGAGISARSCPSYPKLRRAGSTPSPATPSGAPGRLDWETAAESRFLQLALPLLYSLLG